MSTVTFQKVSKVYGKVTALDALDLHVEDGEFISLLGPSGSGKSTTLSLLAGLQDVSGGRVLIGDRDVTDLPPEARDLALVFQNYALYPHMTLFENIAFPLKARSPRPARSEIEQKVVETAATLGLADLLERYPKEISGGQQQRVALGRAMIRNPRVFLLDEPLSNLDARLRIRMRRDLKALHAKIKSTVVYVTHDQSEAMTLSDRIAVFNEGRLQQLGTPEDVYYRPANRFIANFVGDREANMFRATVTGEGQTTRLEGSGITLHLNRPLPPTLPRDVLAGVRAESVSISDPGTAGVHAIGRVSDVELVGADLFVFVETEVGNEVCVRRDPRERIKSGQSVGLMLNAGDIHLFDPATDRCVSFGDAGASNSSNI